MKSVTFSTQCYDRDWYLVLDEDRLSSNISNNNFKFSESIVLINISDDYSDIKEKCESLKSKGIITDYYLICDYLEEICNHYSISESTFSSKKSYYLNLYNLAAIYLSKSDYVVFYTGDSICVNKSKWINDSLDILKEDSKYLCTNQKWSSSPITEHFKEIDNFYVSDSSFSDQNYMIKRKKFLDPEIIKNLSEKNFPHGDTFEMRVHGYMKKYGMYRCIHKTGQYEHLNFF